MAQESEIWKICKRCEGIGEVPSTQPDPDDPGSYNPVMVTCNRCDGVGKHLWGYTEK